MTQCVKTIILHFVKPMELNYRKYSKKRFFGALAATVCISAGLLSQGCLDDIQPEREVRDYGTFGTELYNIVYDNSVHSKDHSSEAFLSTFRSHRDNFIDAVDTSIIAEDYDTLNQVFIDIVPLYENLLYPGTLRKVAVVLDELRQSPDAVDAMTWLSVSPTLLAKPGKVNPIGHLFAYDEVRLATVTDELLSLLLSNASGDRNATNQFLKEISIAAADLEYDDDENRFVRRAVEMLLKPNKLYAPAISYEPQWAAALDGYGRPKVLPEMASVVGTMDDMGFYMTPSGALIAPFEMTGSAPGFALTDAGLQYEGKPVFELIDLQQTMLGYFVREGDAILQDDTLDEALRAVKPMLGTPQTYSDENGTYTGFARDSIPAQLLAAVFTTIDDDSVGPNLEAIVQVLENHRDVVARLFYDIDIIIDVVRDTPSNFSPDNNLIDRLVPDLRLIVDEPGLLNDLLMAIDDPLAAHIAPILAELATQRKSFIKYEKNSKYEVCFQACDEKYKVGTLDRMQCIRKCPKDVLIGNQKADHNAPETLENRSLFQRITNLMWETSATPYDVHATYLSFKDVDLTSAASALGTLISFDNLAESYLLTYTQDLKLVDHLSETFIKLAALIGDDGTTVAKLLTQIVDNFFDLKLSVNPTTAEVTRMFNMPTLSSKTENYQIDLNIATCRSGFSCLEANADVLFAIEASGLVDALYPVVKVFNDHGKTAIFARIVATIFEYYPSKGDIYKDVNGKPLDIYPMDFRSMEPMLVKALEKTDIVADVGAFGDALLEVTLADGSKLTHRFEEFVQYLFRPDKELKNIKGLEYSKDPQGNIIAPLSPVYMYIDLVRELIDFFDAHEDIEDKFEYALDGISKITIQTVKAPDGSIDFEKPAGVQVVADIVSLLHKIFVDKTQEGRRSKWIQEDAIPGVQDFLSGRLLYAYYQLFDELDARYHLDENGAPESGLVRFRRLVLHLMESGNEVPTHLTGAGYLLSDWILEQKFLNAMGHVIASPIDPDRVWTTEGFSELSFVMTLLTCVNAFNECDPTHAFNHVFYRLFETDTRDRSNLFRLLDVGTDLLRVTPGSPLRRNSADMKVLLDFAHDLFIDDDRGVERIYQVIDFTIWGNDRRPKDWKPEDAHWLIEF